MFYHIIDWLQDMFPQLPGLRLFNYITFRASIAVICSLTIATIYGKKIIHYLKQIQAKETIRDLGLAGEQSKKNTPTMGGIIIILAILIPTLLFSRLTNVYIILCLVSTIWLGLIGMLDDYIKIFKKDKAGLAGKFKLLGQVCLGVVVATTLYHNSDVVVLKPVKNIDNIVEGSDKMTSIEVRDSIKYFIESKEMVTNLPFVKDHEFSYAKILTFISKKLEKYTFVIYALIVIFIIASVSNGANLTDGLDGLVAGISATIGFALGVFAYVSGNYIFSDYLNIYFLPHLGELSIFIGSFVGACIGFLWYNSYPAKVFMGDTGSLTLGGVLASIAIIVRKELLIPILCGVFLIESLSVIIQVAYFKYTKWKFGKGRRVFLMSPLHHHYQKKGYHESTLVVRFWIISIVLAIVSILTLKIR